MSIRILVDSTANLNPRLQSRVDTVALTVHFGEHTYTDGVTITPEAFYRKLASAEELPRTSQASPYMFSEAFEAAVNAGDTVVAVVVSSALSGTYQSAVIAASEYPGKVFVVDSRNIAIGAGVLVEYAFTLLDRGLGAREIAQALEQARERVRLMAVVDTLEYLHKGGRVSRAVAIAGGILAIKPIIGINSEGRIEMMGKARGNRQANAQMNKMAQELGIDFSMPVMIGYTGISDELMQRYLVQSEDFLADHPYTTSIVSAVVGTHAGPDAVALAFFSK